MSETTLPEGGEPTPLQAFAGVPVTLDGRVAQLVDDPESETGVSVRTLIGDTELPEFPTSLPPTGGAGGALSGTYPAPGFNTTALDTAAAARINDPTSATAAALATQLATRATPAAVTAAIAAQATTDAATYATKSSALQSIVSPADFAYLRGVNTAGGGGSQENPARVPGTAETDYHFNSQQYYDFLRSRGHRIARIDFLWERVQPTLGGPLDATKLGELKAAVQRAANAGMFVLLDMKNYGRYWLPNDTQVKLGAGITAAQFADVWQRLAIEFADQPAVAMFGLMNEPYDLPDHPDATVETIEYTPAATLFTFDSATSGWNVNGGGATVEVGSFPGMTGAGALKVTKTLGSGSQLMQVQSSTDGGDPLKSANFPAGSVVEFEVYIDPANAGTWKLRGALITNAFGYAWNSYQTALAKGVIHRFHYVVPEAQLGTAHQHGVLEFGVDGNGSGVSSVYVGHVTRGSMVTIPANGLTIWKDYSQAAVDAIRSTDDKRTISVAGDEYGAAWSWVDIQGDPWITDPADNIVYECHQYFDAGGYYEDSYDDYNAQAILDGYTGLQDRVLNEFGRFTDWLADYNVRGFIGEIGWPGDRSDAENAQWNALGQAVYDLLNTSGVGATYWASGEWLQDPDGSMYMMDAYNRDQLEPQPQTRVIEAPKNLSTPAGR